LTHFLREVQRVLRPGGHFLYADIMLRERLPERQRMLDQAGLKIVEEHDITSNVLASLDSDTDQRLALAETLAPVLGVDAAREWMMVPGAQTLDRLRVGTLCYMSMAVRVGQPSVQARASDP
jgi:hypothetical protein